MHIKCEIENSKTVIADAVERGLKAHLCLTSLVFSLINASLRKVCQECQSFNLARLSNARQSLVMLCGAQFPLAWNADVFLKVQHVDQDEARAISRTR